MTIDTPQTAMVIMAHPDDPEFFCGGTVALWSRAGCDISYLVLTNGNKGSDDPDMTPTKLSAIRRVEQQAAADVLGVKRVIYLDEPDGELQPTLELRRRVVAEIRRHQPEVIIAPDPTRYFYTDYINHADHRAAGIVAIDAVFPAARNRMYHPELLSEGLLPHTVKQVYLVGPEQPDRWLDITSTIDAKIEAIRCHVSQVNDMERMEERVRGRHEAVDEYGQTVMREGYRILTIG